MEMAWEKKKGDIKDLSIFDEIEVVVTTAEEATSRALLVSEEFLGTREALAQVSGNAVDTALYAGHTKMDSKLQPKNALGQTISKEESSLWNTEFNACLDWNLKALGTGMKQVGGSCGKIASNLIRRQPC